MADGLTHHKYLRLGWIIIVPAGIFITVFIIALKIDYYYLYPFFFYFNYLMCNIIDPDSDQLSITLSEGVVLRMTRGVWIGFFGALFVSYSFIYAYLIGLVGGHRSVFSHGWVVGTIGRMIYFNIPLFYLLWSFYVYGLSHWNLIHLSFYNEMWMDVWLLPYMSMQFLAWNYGDAIHLILDTEWAKYKLYTPLKNRRR